MTDLFKLISRYPGFALQGESDRWKRKTWSCGNRSMCFAGERRSDRTSNNTDRFLFVWLYRWFPSVLEVVAIVRPETIIRWHRAGFRRIGAGDPATVLADRRSRLSCARSLAR